MNSNLASGAPAIHNPALNNNKTNVPVDLSSLEKQPGSVHFIGIGGIGMSALARLVLARGIEVSGSDRAASAITHELAEAGARVHIGHARENVEQSKIVVISTAIDANNPETVEAAARGIPIIHRSDMLVALTRDRKLIGVSGTHGKTTTTGMIAQLLIDAGLDPSVVVGGVFETIGSNSRVGKSDIFVAEIDESDGSQTRFSSHISVVTNIEPDHLENYPGGFAQIQEYMRTYALNTSDSIILCLDDAGCVELRDSLLVTKTEDSEQERPRIITYGKHDEQVNASLIEDFTHYSYKVSGKSSGPTSMKVFRNSQELGEVEISVPGEHNKSNALAAIATALELGADFSDICHSISGFRGVNRRFQVLGKLEGITVVDDYAHHPTEVAATLSAAREYSKMIGETHRIVALFQPHQPGRLLSLWREFLDSFTEADKLLVADIYVARGKSIEGVSSSRFVEELEHPDAEYIGGSTGELAGKLLEHLQPGDIVITIGAGDITSVGPQILELLARRSQARDK